MANKEQVDLSEFGVELNEEQKQEIEKRANKKPVLNTNLKETILANNGSLEVTLLNNGKVFYEEVDFNDGVGVQKQPYVLVDFMNTEHRLFLSAVSLWNAYMSELYKNRETLKKQETAQLCITTYTYTHRKFGNVTAFNLTIVPE